MMSLSTPKLFIYKANKKKLEEWGRCKNADASDNQGEEQ